MAKRFVPPEWPKAMEHVWVKFADRANGRKACPQGHMARADGAFRMWYLPEDWPGRPGRPQFRLEDGWYWPYEKDGTPTHKECGVIEWMEDTVKGAE